MTTSSFLDYTPSKKQLMFHQIQDKTVKVLLCGVGFGKTTALVFELFKKMWHDHPGETAIAAAPSYNLLKQGLYATWQKHVPKDLYKFNSVSGEMILSNNSKILWRTTSDSEHLRGINAVFVAYDEASVDTNSSAFSEFMARIRNTSKDITPQIAITTTPNGYNWIVDEFNDGPGKVVRDLPSGGKQEIVYEGRKDIWWSDQTIVIRARTFDNPAFPLDSKYVQQLLRKPTASPEWIAQHIYAEFVSKEGIVFSEFKQSNIVDIAKQKYNFRKYYAAFDFGFTAPSCLTIIGRTDENKFIVIEEVYKNKTLWDQSGWFQIFDQMAKKYRLSNIICDSAHIERIRATNAYFGNRVRISSSIKRTAESIQRMNKLFNEQKLLISKDCVNTLKEIQSWAWMKSKSGQEKDIPEGRGDHAIDPIRYFLMSLSVMELDQSSFY